MNIRSCVEEKERRIFMKRHKSRRNGSAKIVEM